MRLPDILKLDWTDGGKGRSQAAFARRLQEVAHLLEAPRANTVSAWFNGPNVPRPELVEPIRVVLGYASTSARARRLREACAAPRTARAEASAAAKAERDGTGA